MATAAASTPDLSRYEHGCCLSTDQCIAPAATTSRKMHRGLVKNSQLRTLSAALVGKQGPLSGQPPPDVLPPGLGSEATIAAMGKLYSCAPCRKSFDARAPYDAASGARLISPTGDVSYGPSAAAGNRNGQLSEPGMQSGMEHGANDDSEGSDEAESDAEGDASSEVRTLKRKLAELQEKLDAALEQKANKQKNLRATQKKSQKRKEKGDRLEQAKKAAPHAAKISKAQTFLEANGEGHVLPNICEALTSGKVPLGSCMFEFYLGNMADNVVKESTTTIRTRESLRPLFCELSRQRSGKTTLDVARGPMGQGRAETKFVDTNTSKINLFVPTDKTIRKWADDKYLPTTNGVDDVQCDELAIAAHKLAVDASALLGVDLYEQETRLVLDELVGRVVIAAAFRAKAGALPVPVEGVPAPGAEAAKQTASTRAAAERSLAKVVVVVYNPVTDEVLTTTAATQRLPFSALTAASIAASTEAATIVRDNVVAKANASAEAATAAAVAAVAAVEAAAAMAGQEAAAAAAKHAAGQAAVAVAVASAHVAAALAVLPEQAAVSCAGNLYQ